MQVRTTERENTIVILSIITLTPVPLLPGTCRVMSGLGERGGGGGVGVNSKISASSFRGPHPKINSDVFLAKIKRRNNFFAIMEG